MRPAVGSTRQMPAIRGPDALSVIRSPTGRLVMGTPHVGELIRVVCTCRMRMSLSLKRYRTARKLRWNTWKSHMDEAADWEAHALAVERVLDVFADQLKREDSRR